MFKLFVIPSLNALNIHFVSSSHHTKEYISSLPWPTSQCYVSMKSNMFFIYFRKEVGHGGGVAIYMYICSIQEAKIWWVSCWFLFSDGVDSVSLHFKFCCPLSLHPKGDAMNPFRNMWCCKQVYMYIYTYKFICI